MTFKEQMEADLDEFLNIDEFAHSAKFSRTWHIINLLLDSDQDPETGRFVDYVTVRISDVPGVVPGDTFTIGTEVYRVVSAKPEPIGGLMCVIRVEK